MTTPIEEQQAIIEAANLAIAEIELPVLQVVNIALASPVVASILAVLNDSLTGLTGERQQQAQYLITILNNCPAFLTAQEAYLDGIVNPPEDPPIEE